MSKAEEEYWLALVRAPNVGPITFQILVKHFKSPRGVFEADQSEWQDLKLKVKLKEKLQNYLQNPDWFAVEKDMQWLDKPNHHLLTLDHPDYPPLLRSEKIADRPPLLFIHGDAALLSSKQLAIVGTRYPSSEGEQTAREFAEYLSHQGLTITSGMALGIDGAAHCGALAGSGKTIAVAGTGLDRIYPPQHRELAHKIAETGALVSELPLGTSVQRRHFPIRSRVVSGLCLGTLVVEAPERSGALYAAKHALKQEREVFAIPGSINNPLVKGCHQLIKKKGAKLVEKATDILEDLQIYRSLTTPNKIETPHFSPKQNTNNEIHPVPSSTTTDSPASQPVRTKPKNNPSDLDSNDVQLLNLLEAGPTSIDALVEKCGFTAASVSSMLLMLELRGLVTLNPGGLYARI